MVANNRDPFYTPPHADTLLKWTWQLFSYMQFAFTQKISY